MAIKASQFREVVRVGGFPVDRIEPGMFDHERSVVFTVNGKQHAGWVHVHHLNEARMLIEAWIVADIEDSWLVSLPPSCEMFSGERFQLKPEEQHRFIPMP